MCVIHIQLKIEKKYGQGLVFLPLFCHSGYFVAFFPAFMYQCYKCIKKCEERQDICHDMCYLHPEIKKNGKCQNVLGQFVMSGYNSHKTGPLLQGMYAALHSFEKGLSFWLLFTSRPIHIQLKKYKMEKKCVTIYVKMSWDNSSSILAKME